MKTKQKNNIIHIISDIFLVIAICLLNYPTGTDVVNAIKTARMHTEYNESIESVDLDKTEADVKEYNKKLLNNSDRLMTEKNSDEYNSLMDIVNNIICYVNCEKAGIVDVPVYHGATTEMLQKGAGHICGTSFPSDQQGVNTAISGHSGMAGMKMFSQLPRIEIGDTFTVNYLNKTLLYTVDKITVTLPDDISPLGIDINQNYCTLITCTPIGINTHRLIVRGVLSDIQLHATSVSQGSNFTLTEALNRFATYELIMTGLSVILLILFISDIIKTKKNKETIHRKKDNNEKC